MHPNPFPYLALAAALLPAAAAARETRGSPCAFWQDNYDKHMRDNKSSKLVVPATDKLRLNDAICGKGMVKGSDSANGDGAVWKYIADAPGDGLGPVRAVFTATFSGGPKVDASDNRTDQQRTQDKQVEQLINVSVWFKTGIDYIVNDEVRDGRAQGIAGAFNALRTAVTKVKSNDTPAADRAALLRQILEKEGKRQFNIQVPAKSQPGAHTFPRGGPLFADYEDSLFTLAQNYELVKNAVRGNFYAEDKQEGEEGVKHFNTTHISILFTTPAECKEVWAPVFCLIDPSLGADLVSDWKRARRMVNEINEWVLTSDCTKPTMEHSNELNHNMECPHGGTVEGLAAKLNLAASGGPPVVLKPKELDKKTKALFQQLEGMKLPQ